MKIDGYASNFMYWDGVGSVDFGPTPTANYIFGFENFLVPAYLRLTVRRFSN